MIVTSILLLIILTIGCIVFYIYRIKNNHRNKNASLGMIILFCFTLIYCIYVYFIK